MMFSFTFSVLMFQRNGLQMSYEKKNFFFLKGKNNRKAFHGAAIEFI